METAKVDIRKLQTLSDSINRTIEALNQVRLSVHGGGLGHSAPIGLQALGAPAYGYALGSPYAVSPLAAQLSPLSQQALGALPGVIQGLAHSASSAYLPSIAAAQAAAAYTNPIAASLAGLGGLSALGGLGNLAGINPLTSYYSQSGLGHSGALGAEYSDPYAAARIAQTFPFVHWGYSPFGSPSV